MTSRRCIDSSVDDVSFLSYVIRNAQQLLPGIPIKPQVAVSGYSNGGMMIQTLLCQQPDIANSLAGVALIGTMLGTDFAASSCQQKLPRSLPLLWLHGVQDPVLPFEPGSCMRVNALGAGEQTHGKGQGREGVQGPCDDMWSRYHRCMQAPWWAGKNAAYTAAVLASPVV